MTADDLAEAADADKVDSHRGRKQFLGVLGASVIGLGGFSLGSAVPRAAASTRQSSSSETRALDAEPVLAPGRTGVDDAVAIRAAVLRAAPSGSRVVLGAGTFAIGSAITLPHGVALHGASAGSTVLTISASFDGDALMLGDASAVYDIGFQAQDTARIQGTYITIPGNECVVERCTFKGSYVAVQVGTSLRKSIAAIVSRCIVREPSLAPGTGGIDLVNYGNASITDCVLVGPSDAVSPPDFGIRVLTGDTAIISNTNVTGYGIALDIATAYGKNSTAFQAVNCLFDSAGGRSAEVMSSARIVPEGRVNNTLFSNCWFGLATENGCTVGAAGTGGVYGISFNGCQFVFSAGDGLSVSGAGVVNWSVTGGSSSGNGGAGIRAASGASSFVITGHTAGGSSDAHAVNAGRGPNVNGIRIESGATDYVVMGCKATGNTLGGIVDESGDNGSVLANNVRPAGES